MSVFDQAGSDRDWWKWMPFCEGEDDEAVDVDSSMPEPLCLLIDTAYSQSCSSRVEVLGLGRQLERERQVGRGAETDRPEGEEEEPMLQGGFSDPDHFSQLR